MTNFSDFFPLFFQLHFMQLFSAEATIFFRIKVKKIDDENFKKLPSKIAHNRPNSFYSIVKRPKTSPNLNFCSIKIAHVATYV